MIKLKQKLDLKKMQRAWQAEDITDNYIADEIGISHRTLQKKLSGDRTSELSATQAFIICEILKTTVDMFIKKEN